MDVAESKSDKVTVFGAGKCHLTNDLVVVTVVGFQSNFAIFFLLEENKVFAGSNALLPSIKWTFHFHNGILTNHDTIRAGAQEGMCHVYKKSTVLYFYSCLFCELFQSCLFMSTPVRHSWASQVWRRENGGGEFAQVARFRCLADVAESVKRIRGN
jgi:glucan phosphoethanolaminetransferase (alkaline phosphatase superfamily)